MITSKTNEKVKFLKSLNEKKGRMSQKCFYLEGIKVVNEILDEKQAVNMKFIAYSSHILQKVNGGSTLLNRIQTLEIETIELTEQLFQSICDTKTPQGVLVVVPIQEKSFQEILKTGENVLLLDSVQDPGNVGTIIRTCDAFGVKNVFYTSSTTDLYAPKVVRSTMASHCRVSFVKLVEDQLDALKQMAKKVGYTIIGTSLKSDYFLEDYTFGSRNIIVFSNEANGISKEVETICDDQIKIHMSNTAESLNVGVAAGIILHKLYQS